MRSTALAASTRTGYVQHVERLAGSVTAGPWDLTTGELAAWLDRQNWSRDTRRKVLVSVRSFYAWGVAEALVEWAPTAGLPSSQPLTRGPKARPMPPAWAEPWEVYAGAMRASGRTEGTLKLRRDWLRRLGEVAADPWGITTAQLVSRVVGC